jgi:rhodanese-related sulfurtransferase
VDQLIEFIGNHPLLVGAFVFFIVALVVTEGRKGGRGVTVQELVRMVNHESAVVVDLRDRKEFSSGHIAGAINVPYASLASRKDELKSHQDKPVILVCKIGQHASAAGSQLIKEGFSDVRRLSGGMAEWLNANLPLVKN